MFPGCFLLSVVKIKMSSKNFQPIDPNQQVILSTRYKRQRCKKSLNHSLTNNIQKYFDLRALTTSGNKY